MPATASPFSMLGMFMGRRMAPTKRPDKDKDSNPSTIVSVQLKDVAHTSEPEAPTQVAATSSERNGPQPVSVPAGESSDGDESSTDEHLYSVAPQSISHTDPGWTEVATRGRMYSPSHASLSTTDETSQGIKEADIADEIGSMLSESFHQEILPLKHEVSMSSDELPAEVAEVRGLRKDMVDLENELKKVLQELDTAEQASQDLKEENRHRLDALQKKDEEIQAVQKERAEAERQLKLTEGELEAAGRLNQELNNKNIAIRDEIQGLDKVVRGLEKEKSEAREAYSSVKEQLDTALQRNRALLDEKRGHENVIEILRNTVGAHEGDKLRAAERLENEKRRQMVETHELEERLRVLENDKGNALQQLEGALGRNREGDGIKAQLTAALQRNRGLEEENRRIGDEIEGVKSHLRDEVAAARLAQGDERRQKEELQATLRVLEEEMGQYKPLMDERDEKEQQLRSLKETHVKVIGRLKVVRTDLEAAVARNDELHIQNRLQASELQAREGRIRILEKNLAEMTTLQNQRQDEAAERRIRMLEDQVRRQSSELKVIKNQARSGSSYHAGLIKENQSGITVLVDMDTLNTEIFQAAAYMADSLDYKEKVPVSKGAIERASRMIGKPMVLVLMSRMAQYEGEPDSLPIQIALQACMVSCCMKIMASWYPGHWEYADFLATVYSRIQGSASQHNSLRWRALTQAQLKDPSDSQTETEMKNFLRENLVDALHVAGWAEVGSKAQNMLAAFDERLTMIVKLALRLNRHLGEDWEAAVAHPDQEYEPGLMDDAYDDETTTGEDYVVCTTDLGLRAAEGHAIIVKPKVVLRSMMKEEGRYSFD